MYFTLAIVCAALMGGPPAPDPACCYFSAIGQDVDQPGQKAFITWDPLEGVESFTVQPKFAGNARDFGMVVPTPTRPKLQEAPRDLFRALAVFTILKPMDVEKFKSLRTRSAFAPGAAAGGIAPGAETKRVRVLESGVVGSLDYKIIEAQDPEGLFAWLRENEYQYGGDVATLQHYVDRGWTFTVMKIDPKQMKRRDDGSYDGEVTPTRFTFASDRLVYPLRITRISVKDKTDALFYIQAPDKMDLPGDLSYQIGFQQMWSQAFSFANLERCTPLERTWWAHLEERRDGIAADVAQWKKRHPGRTLSTLEWSRRLTEEDLALLSGERAYDREAPAEEVAKLALLRGLLRSGRYLTKCRHVFYPDEMTDDLVFSRAAYQGQQDDVEHVAILPTSPP